VGEEISEADTKKVTRIVLRVRIVRKRNGTFEVRAKREAV
jgi:hypothetical protein